MVTTENPITIRNAVDRIKQLYVAGLQDDFLDRALRKIIQQQIAQDAEEMQKVNKLLTEFEQRYGMTSEEFWNRFQAGEMSDTADFMEWNVFCKIRGSIQIRLNILKGNTPHDQ
jgi:hypothetical protein